MNPPRVKRLARRSTTAAATLLAGLGAFAAVAGLVAGGGRESSTTLGAPVEEVPRATLQEFPGVPYDGTYTFVRVRFNTGRRGFGRGFGRGGGPGWAHDYPDADDNFIKILNEVTLMGPNTDGTNVISADDPELHSYPIAYVSEPGEWAPTQAEVDNLAAYLRKGGFLILDDFRGPREWGNVEAIFNVILPGHRFRQLELEEPIFNSFFQIESLDLPPPTFQQYRPLFLGSTRITIPTGA